MFRLSKYTRSKIDEARNRFGDKSHLVFFVVEHEGGGVQIYADLNGNDGPGIYYTNQNLSDKEVQRRCDAFRRYLESE